MNPFKLLNLDYLFNIQPNAPFAWFWPVVIFFALVFAASWKVNDVLKHQTNKKVVLEFFGGVPNRMREFAFLGIALAFARAESIPYIGMRFWLVLLFAWAFCYAVYLWRNYELKFDEAKRKKSASKSDPYLPKPKKKRKTKRK